MCLSILPYTSKRVSKNSILVYKFLAKRGNGKFITPYYEHPVVFKDGKCVLNVKKFSYYFCRNGVKLVEKGIHAYYEERTYCYVGPSCFLSKHYAIIPAGAKYYIGNDSDIVSTELIVFETEEDYMKYICENNDGKPYKNLHI